jgi:hypothetical protein
MFAERLAGSPQAIQVWFYPGDKIGEEFVYPRRQAIAIAKANHQPVLATSDEGDSNSSEADRMAAMRGASVGRVDENGRMTSDESRRSAAAATTTADNEKHSSTTAAPANTIAGSRQAARRSRNAVGNERTDRYGSAERQPPKTAAADRKQPCGSRTDQRVGVHGCDCHATAPPRG